MPHVDVRVLRVPSPFPAGGNVGVAERWVTGLAGLALGGWGLAKGGRAGGWMAAAGAALLARAVTGYCPVYSLAGRRHDLSWPASTATETKRALSGSRGIRVHAGITVDRPLPDVYAFWRNFENLPRFAKHLESVRVVDDRRSHWIARGPAGSTLEWDAEIIHEEPDKVIGWRSLGDSDVIHAGSVNFDRAPGDRGTEVRISLQYQPPAGKLGAAVAALAGTDPSRQVRDDLRRFKELLETGEVARAE